MKFSSLITAAVMTLGLASTANAGLVCGAPRVFLGDEPNDPNPVVSVEVNYDPSQHLWSVFHHHYNGLVAARMSQYAWEDWSNPNQMRWAGSLNRNRSLYMVGEVRLNAATGEGYYEEWLYNRSQGNRLELHLGTACRLNRPVAPPPPVVVAPVPVPVVPVVPVPAFVPVAPAPAPAPTNNTVQQNGPIVTPQSPNANNITITIVPGTGAEQYKVKPEAKGDGS